MTATATVELETRLEVTSAPVDAWGLLVVLAGEVGLAHGTPPLAAPGGHEIRDMELSGRTWTGGTARLVVTPVVTLFGEEAVSVLLTSSGTDEAAEAHLHDRLVERAGDWLHERDLRWRYRQEWCAPGAWHCGWALSTGHQPHPTVVQPVPVRPVARWRRWLAVAVDWPASLAGYALGGAAWVGLLLHLLGSRAGLHPGRLADLLWRAGVPGHALALLAGAFLAHRVAAVAVDVLDPDGVTPPWWVHAWHHAQDCATTVLLAGAVIALGGGWLA
jgi:hypothetical protein